MPDDKNEGLRILRNNEDSVLVPFRDNVTLTCSNPGRKLRNTATAGFRQCVYDPQPVRIFSNMLHILQIFFITILLLYITSNRDYLTIGYLVRNHHALELIVEYHCQHLVLNMVNTWIPSINHHFSSDAKILLN